jgi:protein-S-isoprenylcysteine O-methyltransferase Ste14
MMRMRSGCGTGSSLGYGDATGRHNRGALGAQTTCVLLKSILTSLAITVLIGAVLFGAAGTVHWFGAELFLAAIFGSGLAMQIWLAVRDPGLMRERSNMAREKNPRERIILMFVNVYYVLWLGAMGLDVRWHGAEQLPRWANAAGAAVIMAGFLAVIRIFAENSFASGLVRVQSDRGHRVIDTGPYALVRHPMYATVIVAYLAVPLVLGCPAGLLGVPPLIVLLGLRARSEEALLKRELAGYGDYMTKVRYRLVPGIW